MTVGQLIGCCQDSLVSILVAFACAAQHVQIPCLGTAQRHVHRVEQAITEHLAHVHAKEFRGELFAAHVHTLTNTVGVASWLLRCWQVGFDIQRTDIGKVSLFAFRVETRLVKECVIPSGVDANWQGSQQHQQVSRQRGNLSRFHVRDHKASRVLLRHLHHHLGVLENTPVVGCVVLHRCPHGVDETREFTQRISAARLVVQAGVVVIGLRSCSEAHFHIGAHGLAYSVFQRCTIEVHRHLQVVVTTSRAQVNVYEVRLANFQLSVGSRCCVGNQTVNCHRVFSVEVIRHSRAARVVQNRLRVSSLHLLGHSSYVDIVKRFTWDNGNFDGLAQNVFRLRSRSFVSGSQQHGVESYTRVASVLQLHAQNDGAVVQTLVGLIVQRQCANGQVGKVDFFETLIDLIAQLDQTIRAQVGREGPCHGVAAEVPAVALARTSLTRLGDHMGLVLRHEHALRLLSRRSCLSGRVLSRSVVVTDCHDDFLSSNKK